MRPVRLYTIVAIVAALLVTLLIALPTNVSWLVAWWIGASLTAFVLYGYDKMRAKQGAGRVPEVVLMGLGLAGGFVGGLLGMVVWHHKTRKNSFYIANFAGLAIALLLFLLLNPLANR